MTNLKSPIRRILSVKINVGSKKEIRLKGANYNAKITHPLQICIPFYITYIYIFGHSSVELGFELIFVELASAEAFNHRDALYRVTQNSCPIICRS